jgi:hypothetical protein
MDAEVSRTRTGILDDLGYEIHGKKRKGTKLGHPKAIRKDNLLEKFSTLPRKAS